MLLGVVLAVGLAGVALWAGQRALIYFPDRTQPPPAGQVLPGARDVTLTTTDGLSLGGWYLPADRRCGATVLLAHGNGGNRTDRADLARAVHDLGFGVLLFDYRGYGANPGRPSEQGLALDVRAARDFLVSGEGVPAGSIVYLGESLGAAVVAELATEHRPAAMVLRSPFTSLADAARAAYGLPLRRLLREDYPVRDHVAHLGGPGLPLAVVYGSADTLVPARLSREVAQAARAAGHDVVEVEVAGTNHNDAPLVQGPDLLQALVEVARRGGATGCG